MPESPIAGPTIMADLVRRFDWSSTPLGTIDTWAEPLLSQVNLLLCSPLPTTLLWGRERIFFYNDAVLPTLGAGHPEALGTAGVKALPHAWHALGQEMEACLRLGETLIRENVRIPLQRGSGTEDFYFSFSFIPIYDRGRIAGVQSVYAESNHIGKQLGESELNERDRLRELFEQAPAFLALVRGPEHVFEMANAAYRKMLGDRELLGCRVIDCVPEVSGTAWITILDGVYRTGVPYSETGARLMLAQTPGGPLEERFVDYVYQPRRKADGTVFGIIALGIDVTDQRRAEKALMQSEKLAVVGRLASSIAHEINNPLGAATNYLYLAGVSGDLQEVKQCVEAANAELQRVSVITTQTLLSQKQTSKPSVTSFEELTGTVLHLYQGRIKAASIKVEVRHRAARPLAAIEGEIRQVLGNLIGNAIDAMSIQGGRLLLRSRAATDWKTGRKGNRMTVADTGAGIEPDLLECIFDPFFTTKGTLSNGLGLWIAQEIITRNQGEIRLRSVAGKPHSGTVFSLFLPEGLL